MMNATMRVPSPELPRPVSFVLTHAGEALGTTIHEYGGGLYRPDKSTNA